MRKRLMLTSALLLSFFTAFAQETTETRNLTIDQAVQSALDYNKTLQISQMDIQYKRKQILEAISQGLPQINTNLDYSTNFGYEMSFGAGTAIKMEDQLSFSASVSQLIFSGQWILGVQTAKIARMVSEQNVDATELDIRSNVHTLYYTILAYQRMSDILEDNLKDMEITREHTENMFSAGVVEETDVDQIRVTVNQLRNQLYSTQRSVQVNKNLFKIECGLSANTEVVLSEDLDGLVANDKYAQLVLEEFDINNNISYQQMLTQEKLQSKMVGLKKWAFAPTISANYTYLEKIVSPSFSMSPKNSAGINLNFPIFTGLQRKAALDMEKITYNEVKTQKSLLEDQLNIQEIQCKFDLKSAIENFTLQQENIEVSEKVLANYKYKYDQGVISSLELTQANTNFLTAQTNYTTAVLTLLDAQVKLQKLHNSL